MKRLIKLMVNLVAIAMLSVACFSLIGCSKTETVTVKLNLAIYNSAENSYYDEEDTTLTLTLYSDYAEETVKAIVSYIEEGYYDDAIFYGMDSNKIMVGDLKMNASGEIYQNELKPTLIPEFERGYVQGSDLLVKEGSIGLWRTWNEKDGHTTSTSLDTGRATWFMPTSEITGYNEWFCIFATMDLTDETNLNTITYLKEAVNGADAETYYIYYTGEYGADDLLNNGLDFHCEEEAPDEDVAFEPKGEQYVCYKQQQIKVAKGAGNTCGARIKSAEII